MEKMEMKNYVLLMLLFVCSLSMGTAQNGEQMFSLNGVTPNDFEGTDIERIRQAIDAATGHTNKVVIPANNANGTNIWLIDSAILIPSNMHLVLDNCTIQLSDQCRDNIFRSDNVGIGITDPQWNRNINIVGVGNVTLKGAANPRATGDGARTLMLNPEKGRVSYGSDAGKAGMKQKGDWRNIMILMAYVDGFRLENVSIENSHAWSVSFERTHNAFISDVRINNPEKIVVDGREVLASNKDGINLRHGCKNFRIRNISGRTGDDFIALSSLDTAPGDDPNGSINSTMVTSRKWRGPVDDTEQIFISNISCQTKYRGVAIRASDSASIHHVYIDGLVTQKWDGFHNSILLGGVGYGALSLPGKINHIFGMNIVGDGRSLILVEAPLADCHFSNGIYYGEGEEVVTYKIEEERVKNLTIHNFNKVN